MILNESNTFSREVFASLNQCFMTFHFAFPSGAGQTGIQHLFFNVSTLRILPYG